MSQNPEDYADFLGELEEAIFDGGEPVAWGWPVVEQVPEDVFNRMRNLLDLMCAGPGQWWVIDKRLTFDDILEAHGRPTQLGVGPRGGFKFVVMGDGVRLTNPMWREGAMKWDSPRIRVVCDRHGERVAPTARTRGKAK